MSVRNHLNIFADIRSRSASGNSVERVPGHESVYLGPAGNRVFSTVVAFRIEVARYGQLRLVNVSPAAECNDIESRILVSIQTEVVHNKRDVISDVLVGVLQFSRFNRFRADDQVGIGGSDIVNLEDVVSVDVDRHRSGAVVGLLRTHIDGNFHHCVSTDIVSAQAGLHPADSVDCVRILRRSNEFCWRNGCGVAFHVDPLSVVQEIKFPAGFGNHGSRGKGAAGCADRQCPMDGQVCRVKGILAEHFFAHRVLRMDIVCDRRRGFTPVDRIRGADFSGIVDSEFSAFIPEHDRVDDGCGSPIRIHGAVCRPVRRHGGIDQIQFRLILRFKCAAVRSGFIESQCGVYHVHLYRRTLDIRRKHPACLKRIVFAESVEFHIESDSRRGGRFDPARGSVCPVPRERDGGQTQIHLLFPDRPAQNIDAEAHEEPVKSAVVVFRQPDCPTVSCGRIVAEEVVGYLRVDVDAAHIAGVSAEINRAASVSSRGVTDKIRTGKLKVGRSLVILPAGHVHENRPSAAGRQSCGVVAEAGVANFHLEITLRVEERGLEIIAVRAVRPRIVDGHGCNGDRPSRFLCGIAVERGIRHGQFSRVVIAAAGRLEIAWPGCAAGRICLAAAARHDVVDEDCATHVTR